ncbi:MAG TPA: replicative DNA helicase [Verrucomicrobiota bacterium]|nr:replicative DNA helicase [Verrucomicrobiota bacterium]
MFSTAWIRLEPEFQTPEPRKRVTPNQSPTGTATWRSSAESATNSNGTGAVHDPTCEEAASNLRDTSLEPFGRASKSRVVQELAGSPPDVSSTDLPPADFKKARRTRPSAPPPGSLGRLPPHSIPAEQGVLGCILLSPTESTGMCVEKLKGGSEAFYDLRHRTLFEHLVVMYDHKLPIDLITLQQRLRDGGQIDAVGGLTYISGLMDAVPSAANLEYYLEIVREKHLLRRMLAACTTVITRVHESEGEVEELLDEVERDILRISEEREEGASRNIKDLVNHAINIIQDYHSKQGQLSGVASGFADLDKMTHGLHGGEMIVIAGRPSMGKTSLAMNIAEHVAVNERLPVGVFSLEMTADSLVVRMLCSLARVNSRAVREGFLRERDFPRITAAASKLAKAPLIIDDTPGLSILQLRARARRMWQQHGIKLFVIDYLQLLHSSSRKAQDNRQQEISDISSGVKALAKELKVPVIVLSQLNRELEKDKSRKPRLSDLRESGAIEQDADVVGLLYKPSAEDDEDRDKERVEPADDGMEAVQVNLLIAKQRNGPTGDVELTFLKGITRYESKSKISGEDVT